MKPTTHSPNSLRPHRDPLPRKVARLHVSALVCACVHATSVISRRKLVRSHHRPCVHPSPRVRVEWLLGQSENNQGRIRKESKYPRVKEVMYRTLPYCPPSPLPPPPSPLSPLPSPFCCFLPPLSPLFNSKYLLGLKMITKVAYSLS